MCISAILAAHAVGKTDLFRLLLSSIGFSETSIRPLRDNLKCKCRYVKPFVISIAQSDANCMFTSLEYSRIFQIFTEVYVCVGTTYLGEIITLLKTCSLSLVLSMIFTATLFLVAQLTPSFTRPVETKRNVKMGCKIK